MGVVALLTTVGAGCSLGVAEPVGPGADQRAILFIGNSLTYENDLPGMVEGLLELGSSEDVFVAAEVIPNFGLPDHWARGRAQELISVGGWEVVVLQQGPSATEGRPYLLDYAEAFAETIRAVQATPALYMVWPARQRSFDFDGVLDSYRTAAERVDGFFFPAGEAWRIAWETDPDLPLYAADDFHPSPYGTYLAALVMYEQLSGLDARDLPAVVLTLAGAQPIDAGLADLLQAAAHEANTRHARQPSPVSNR